MNKEDLLQYIQILLNKPNLDDDFSKEIPNVSLALKAYMAGLARENFPIDNLLSEVNIPKDIPAQYHSTLAQATIVKTNKSDSRSIEYCLESLRHNLKNLKVYVTPPPQS